MNQQTLDLRIFPDSILKKKCEIVTSFGQEVVDFAENMYNMMLAEGGIGLAANQAGVLKNIFVMKDSGEKRFFANPKIIDGSGTLKIEESCLSFPGISVEVKRKYMIELWHQDVFTGEERKEIFKGMAAVVCQHELDHLNGITFLDYVSDFKRKVLESKIRNNQ